MGKLAKEYGILGIRNLKSTRVFYPNSKNEKKSIYEAIFANNAYQLPPHRHTRLQKKDQKILVGFLKLHF